VAESTLMHHEIRVARHDWSNETSDVGETSSKASFMDQPSSIADIDSMRGKLLDGVIEARGWREQRQSNCVVKIWAQRQMGLCATQVLPTQGQSSHLEYLNLQRKRIFLVIQGEFMGTERTPYQRD
jgi:hypothetical protein